MSPTIHVSRDIVMRIEEEITIGDRTLPKGWYSMPPKQRLLWIAMGEYDIVRTVGETVVEAGEAHVVEVTA